MYILDEKYKKEREITTITNDIIDSYKEFLAFINKSNSDDMFNDKINIYRPKLMEVSSLAFKIEIKLSSLRANFSLNLFKEITKNILEMIESLVPVVYSLHNIPTCSSILFLSEILIGKIKKYNYSKSNNKNRKDNVMEVSENTIEIDIKREINIKREFIESGLGVVESFEKLYSILDKEDVTFTTTSDKIEKNLLLIEDLIPNIKSSGNKFLEKYTEKDFVNFLNYSSETVNILNKTLHHIPREYTEELLESINIFMDSKKYWVFYSFYKNKNIKK